jgi:hypothetical protein
LTLHRRCSPPNSRGASSFDQGGTPGRSSRFLQGHTITTAKDAGWDRLVNGELLRVAETAGFEVLVTTDKNMVSQQNSKIRTIAEVDIPLK